MTVFDLASGPGRQVMAGSPTFDPPMIFSVSYLPYGRQDGESTPVFY